MILTIVLTSIILIALFIASVTDLKTREVPDWLNFSLIPLGILIRLFWSLITGDYSFLIAGVTGFVVFFIIALIMFYSGQWGGGDSKMLMGLGALIGLEFSLNTELLSFIINLVLIGAIYGLLWSIVLVIIQRKKFIKELKKFTRSIVKIRKFMILLFIILIFLLLIISNQAIKILIGGIIVIIYTSFYLYIFMRCVEKTCMIKDVKPPEVTEGEWIVNDIIIDQKYICGPKDLGIEKSQLKKLMALYKKGKIKKVKIKIGIPFIPSFFIAYIVTLIFGNVFLIFL